MATHPNVMGLNLVRYVNTLDPKLTYSTHIHYVYVRAYKSIQIIKALTATGWVNRRRHSWLPTRQS